MACTGNAAETCGAGNRLGLFFNDAAPAPPPGPVTNPGVGGWKSLGCYRYILSLLMRLQRTYRLQ